MSVVSSGKQLCNGEAILIQLFRIIKTAASSVIEQAVRDLDRG